MNLAEMFGKYASDYLEFDKVQVKLSTRPDLHAFLLLDSILPSRRDIIAGAEHDEIWLDIACDELATVITEDQVQELRRCGVRYSSEYDSLCLFV